MQKSEVTELVTLAAGNDFREISETNVAAWHKQFGDQEWLTYELAEAAVVEFYNTETRRIMAADILRLAREIRHTRLMETPMPDEVIVAAAEVSDDPAAYRAVHQAAENAIAAGQDPVGAAKLAAAHTRRALDGKRL